MTITKDESIVAQVAAKIAADLVVKNQPLEDVLSDWATAFQFTKEQLFEMHSFGQPSATISTGGIVTASGQGNPYTINQVADAFPGSTQVSSIRIRGDQHGPIPDWLEEAAARAGVTEVYDNRNDLGPAGNRPHFKATTGGRDAASFWPPKASGGRR